MPPKPAEARRKATNLSLSEDVLAEARRLGINVSRAAEAGVRQAIASEAAQRWKIENADAIRWMNAYVEKHGLPLAKYRQL